MHRALGGGGGEMSVSREVTRAHTDGQHVYTHTGLYTDPHPHIPPHLRAQLENKSLAEAGQGPKGRLGSQGKSEGGDHSQPRSERRQEGEQGDQEEAQQQAGGCKI